MSSPYLVVLTGSLQGRRVPIEGQLTIGRNPDSGLQLDDLQISRRHAIVEQTPQGCVLRDLGSGNGTYVDDRRILEYRLTHGDVVHIGQVRLRFENPAPTTQRAPARAPRPSGVRLKSGMEGTLEASSAANVYQTFIQAPGRAATADELRDAQSRLAVVYKANQIIAQERDLRRLFPAVIEQVFSLVPAHNGVIMLRDERTSELVTEYVRSKSGDVEVVISSTIVNRASENGEAIVTINAADDARFEAGRSIIAQNISSAMCAPLTHQEETLGVIYVDTRGTTNAFKQSDLELLVALAAPAAIAIKNAQYVNMIERSYQDTLIALANAVEMRDHYTVGHTWRVTNFAMQMAAKLGWDEERLKLTQMGGLLHDVGKIAVADAILNKPGRLTDEIGRAHV